MSSKTDSTLEQKVKYAILPAVVFFLVSLPQVYGITDKVGATVGEYASPLGYHSYDGGCPTSTGKFLHSVVFFLVNWLLMQVARNRGWMGSDRRASNDLLAKYAFYATLIFFMVSSTDAYRVTGRFASGLATKTGCPNVRGIVVHALVFLVVLTLVMYFPKDD